MAKRTDPVRGPWRIDLHTHTHASRDSKTLPRDLIARARELSLARIAVTDHNTIAGALEARSLAPDLIIVGEEIAVAGGGEVIAYFVEEEVPRGLSLDETLHRLRDQGALISVSHPLDSLRNSALGAAQTLAIIGQVDALEVFNARCLRNGDNRQAQALALAHGKLPTAGSDAHTLGEVGAGYLTLPPFKGNAAALCASLVKAQVGGHLTGLRPHLLSTWAKLSKRGR